jgi:hypothetical protein
MKAIVAYVTACLNLLMGATAVDAAIRYGQDSALGGSALFEESASFGPERSAYDEMLIENGVEPGSSKAELIIGWVERIHRDPAIVGNVQRMSGLFLDSHSRSEIMADGLVRLPPYERLQYVKLMTKLLDTLVPADCFGFNDMNEVMNHLTLKEMSNADIDEYFRLLLGAVRASALKAPFDIPTSQQLADAEMRLRQALIVELSSLEANVMRYQAYIASPHSAAPDDVCWANRVTMHAILAMPEPDRDVVLRNIVGHGAVKARPRDPLRR